MSEELQQQAAGQPERVQERPKIDNPLELLKSGSEKLAKFGGFDLIESSIEGSANLNPERKARRNIFLTESQKKDEREALKKALSLWAEVLESSNEISDMVNTAEQKAEQCQSVLEKNLAKAVEETRNLERSYR